MRTFVRWLAAAVLSLGSMGASAAFHIWIPTELSSNADGTVQFLELQAQGCCQQFLAGHTIDSSNGITTNTFTFPTSLPGDTTNKRMLIGTAGFAALGIVTPDFVVPNGFFFRGGGTIRFPGVADGPATDTWAHGAIPAPPLSLNRDNTTGTNSPSNFAGEGPSLVTHYYRSILRREPDSGGKAFWQSEATRVTNLGANINEVWFAMAQTFYFSSEYAAFNRDNTGFATDLYVTFFNRPPDQGGLNFWKGQLDQGMPREVALASFMFSQEFAAFTTAIFGNTAARAEVDAVMDFYRGLLSRLPDDGGFNFWVQRFRTAQCQGAPAVVSEVEAVSSQFALSAEYGFRNRSNAQYVGDLYNAFLRRGGDLGGVQFWIDQIGSGARTRENVRVEFRNSSEFQSRVQAIIGQGCSS